MTLTKTRPFDSKTGLSRGKDELIKGRLVLEHSLGLGHQPNVVPRAEPTTNAAPRAVHIGWHPVAGFAGKWLAERTKLGTWITEKVHKYPDPSQHWAVLVGDYRHELWMDEKLDIIYVNGRVDAEEWRTFPVGETRCNDEALRQAAELVITQMRERRPAYNLISNNCQNFALLLLDAIQIVAATRTDFATSLAVVKTATGPGKINDLFSDKPAPVADVAEVAAVEQQQVQQAQDPNQPQFSPPPVPLQKENSIVALARRLMDEHTTKLDTHHHAR